MGGFVKGDVVVLPFPFSDLTGSKVRPAFVVSTLQGDDVILCMITTQNRADAYSVPICSTDFSSGDLPRDSFVRPNRLFTADTRKILKIRGRLKQQVTSQIIDMIVKIVTS